MHSQGGFTLLELLAVVAVDSLGNDARESACASDARALRTAQELHRAQHGSYASEADLVDAGLLEADSALNDIELLGDDYSIVPGEDCGGDTTTLTAWRGLARAGDFTFGPDGAVRVGGSGERQAVAEMDPMASGRIDLLGTLMTRGNGWGLVVHAVTDERDGLTGYVFQMDPGYGGGRFVLRHRGPGGETAPLAVTAPPDGFDWRVPHDVSVRVDGQRMVASVDGTVVMEVDDLAAAADRVGSRHDRTESGAVGLRLWSTTDLTVGTVRVTPS
ncbi:MAG: prepilin-type N-terminal cleavage/methylation domain-containing protein [Microthrixaceae bacterium]